MSYMFNDDKTKRYFDEAFNTKFASSFPTSFDTRFNNKFPSAFDTRLKNSFTVKTTSILMLQINPLNNGTGNIDLSNDSLITDGYKPVGVVGYTGVNNGLTLVNLYISNNKVNIKAYNSTQSVASLQFCAYVLWVKS